MMPVWIFAVFIVLFAAAYIWERIAYERLKLEFEIVGNYLDMYISKYGPLPGIVEVGEVDDTDGKKQ